LADSEFDRDGKSHRQERSNLYCLQQPGHPRLSLKPLRPNEFFQRLGGWMARGRSTTSVIEAREDIRWLSKDAHCPLSQVNLDRLWRTMDKRSLTERDICTKFVLPALEHAGWDGMLQVREEGVD
jgi:hypothetical protein